jgi:anti-sigma-K factor RskA
MRYDRPDLLDRLAAEYALGTLQGGARRRFRRVLLDSAAARTAVAAWEARLGSLAGAVPHEAPPRHLWHAIEQATGGKARTATRRVRGAWFRPALGFVFGALAAVGATLMAPQYLVSLDRLAQREQALPQSYVGLLTDAAGQPTLLVSSTRHGRRVTVKFLRPVALGSGKRLQVWALSDHGPPVPLGVVRSVAPPGNASFDMADSADRLLARTARLGVSVEDEPAALSTAPPDLLLSGFCVKLW